MQLIIQNAPKSKNFKICRLKTSKENLYDLYVVFNYQRQKIRNVIYVHEVAHDLYISHHVFQVNHKYSENLRFSDISAYTPDGYKLFAGGVHIFAHSEKTKIRITNEDVFNFGTKLYKSEAVTLETFYRIVTG